MKTLGNIAEEQVLYRPLKCTIIRKTKPNIVMYFDTMDNLKNFNAFLEELIENVKKKTKEELRINDKNI